MLLSKSLKASTLKSYSHSGTFVTYCCLCSTTWCGIVLAVHLWIVKKALVELFWFWLKLNSSNICFVLFIVIAIYCHVYYMDDEYVRLCNVHCVLVAMCCTFFVLQRHQGLHMLGWNLYLTGSLSVVCLQWRLSREWVRSTFSRCLVPFCICCSYLWLAREPNASEVNDWQQFLECMWAHKMPLVLCK